MILVIFSLKVLILTLLQSLFWPQQSTKKGLTGVRRFLNLKLTLQYLGLGTHIPFRDDLKLLIQFLHSHSLHIVLRQEQNRNLEL